MDPIWLIGPAGDLRALECPERDVVVTPDRYGGSHQGLSGARTMDVTGLRMRYEMQFTYLAESEYAWLQAMHFKSMPGPFRMINPLVRNRLTPESSVVKFSTGTARGATVSTNGGLGTRMWDVPAGIPGQSMKWTNRSGFSAVRFDYKNKTTVSASENIVASIYMKASEATTIALVFDWYNRSTQNGSSSATTVNLTTSWQRFTYTATVPSSGVNLANFVAYTSLSNPDIYFAGAQVEAGTVPTSWVMGGGAPVVLLDQLETTSPYFPYVSTKAIFLEA